MVSKCRIIQFKWNIINYGFYQSNLKGLVTYFCHFSIIKILLYSFNDIEKMFHYNQIFKNEPQTRLNINYSPR